MRSQEVCRCFINSAVSQYADRHKIGCLIQMGSLERNGLSLGIGVYRGEAKDGERRGISLRGRTTIEVASGKLCPSTGFHLKILMVIYCR